MDDRDVAARGRDDSRCRTFAHDDDAKDAPILIIVERKPKRIFEAREGSLRGIRLGPLDGVLIRARPMSYSSHGQSRVPLGR